MEMNNRTDADFMLKNALRRSETPSPELLNKVRFNSRSDGNVIRMHQHPRKLALVAILAIMLLTISTVALAYTGVLSDFFSAISNGSTANGGIGSDSRKAILEQGYVASVTPSEPASADGNTLELIAYYADAKEIGLNFILSGTDLPDNWDTIFFNSFCLEMTCSGGEINSWEQIVDFENGFDRRTFPGGYCYDDWKNNIFEYEPTDGRDTMESIAVADVQDFQHYAVAEKVGDTTYEITLIISFHKASVVVGENARLSIGNLRFTTFGDISDDNAVDQHIMLDGEWEFTVDIESMFTDNTELSYIAINADELARQGIMIERVIVLPSVCRIEASIDFNKAGLADLDNVNRTDSPRQLGKFDWLDSYVHAISGGEVYRFMRSDYTEVDGRVVKCWYEVESMFFDAPENLALILEGYGDTVIEISLVLNN